MNPWRLFAALSFATAFLWSHGSMPSAIASASSTEMVAILRNASIVKPDYPLRVNLTNGEALIATKKDPTASAEHCKIAAILLAKALSDAYPAEVVRVKVLFSDSETGTFNQISVSKGDIAAYGAGEINKDEFLKSIEMSTFQENTSPFRKDVEQSNSLSITPGALQDKRLLLLSRIEGLKQKGTNVKMFMDYFNSIEDRVKSGDDAEVAAMVNSLSNKISEQEKAREVLHSQDLKYEVLKFQTEMNHYASTGKPLPFNPAQVIYLEQLVVQGRNTEATELMARLRQMMMKKPVKRHK